MMQRDVSLTITDAYCRRFPELRFGIGTIQDCTYFEKSESFKRYKRDLLRKMRRRDNLIKIEERINTLEEQAPDMRETIRGMQAIDQARLQALYTLLREQMAEYDQSLTKVR